MPLRPAGRLARTPWPGIGRSLIGGLAQLGTLSLGTDECSLFVVEDNAPAIGLYERLGFVRAVYPEDAADVRAFVYMVTAADQLVACGD